MKNSDVIAICLPLNNETKNLISDNEISKMKKGAILVNCAMEAIVNKQAVLKGLAEKKLFGYGIETNIMVKIEPDDPYYKYPNIVLTPHNAFNTQDADKNSYELVAENIKAYLAGKPQNLV